MRGPGWDVFVSGGRINTGIDAVEWAREVERRGCGEILLTSMDGDGTKEGYDIALTRAISEAVSIPVIASGGVTNLDDVRALSTVAKDGIIGAITGRAIYQGTLDFAEAQKLADELAGGVFGV